MPAGVQDIEGAEQGADFTYPITITGLTSLTAARMQVRSKIDVDPPVLDLDTASKGGLVITNPSAGVFVLTIALTDTQTKAVGIKRGVYDIFIECNLGTVKLLKGSISFDPDVTR